MAFVATVICVYETTIPNNGGLRMKAFACLLTCIAVLSITGCATHGPTHLRMGTPTPAVTLPSGTVDIVVHMNYLKKVDSVDGSQRSNYERDQRLIEDVISDVLKQFPGSDGMRLADAATSIRARFRCNITVHQFVAWKENLLILLPIPTSNNESICVQATLFDTERNQEVKKYEEWGYNKQNRFFIFEGRDKPPLNEMGSSLLLTHVR